MNLQDELLEKKREMLVELEKKRSSNEILWNEFYEMIRTKLREEFQKHPYEDSVKIILDQDSKDKDYVYQDLIQSLIYGGKDSEFLQSFLKFTSQEGIIVGIDRSYGYSKINCKMIIDPKEIEKRRADTELIFEKIKNDFSIHYYVQMSQEDPKEIRYSKFINYDEMMEMSYFLDLCKKNQIEVVVSPTSKILRNVQNQEYVDYKMFLMVKQKEVAQWSSLKDILKFIIAQTESKANDFLDPYHYRSRRQAVIYLGGISDELLSTVDDNYIGNFKHLISIEDQIIDIDYYKKLLREEGCFVTINDNKNVLRITGKKQIPKK